MKVFKEVLLEELLTITEDNSKKAAEFNILTTEQLNWKESAESWSILECLEHLNLYGDFYLPEIGRAMLNSTFDASPVFKPGVLGNYFANLLRPKEKLNKMKTLQSKNPINSKLDRKTINRFIVQQQKTLDLIEIARSKDLTKIKTAISISKWIKLRLGDTFKVVIYHNQRHIVQCSTIMTHLK